MAVYIVGSISERNDMQLTNQKEKERKIRREHKKIRGGIFNVCFSCMGELVLNLALLSN